MVFYCLDTFGGDLNVGKLILLNQLTEVKSTVMKLSQLSDFGKKYLLLGHTFFRIILSKIIGGSLEISYINACRKMQIVPSQG